MSVRKVRQMALDSREPDDDDEDNRAGWRAREYH